MYYVHQSCSVEGKHLNQLAEGNQYGLFRSIVFERITRQYPPPPTTTTTHKYFLHTKYWGPSPCGFRQIGFFMFSLDEPLRNMLPPVGPFCAQGHNLNILGRGRWCHITNIKVLGSCGFREEEFYLFSLYNAIYKTCDPRGGTIFDPTGIGRGPLGDAKYQVSRLSALWFQTRKLFSQFP